MSYASTAPSATRSDRPYSIAEHRAWCRALRNPTGLESSDEWFRRHPSAMVRVVGIAVPGGRWWNVRFIPRRGPTCELLAEQVRDILAQRFSNGTPRERLSAIVDWFFDNGVFAGRTA